MPRPHARTAGRGPRRQPGSSAASRERSSDVRVWAKEAGIAVSERGRIPPDLGRQEGASTHDLAHVALADALSGPQPGGICAVHCRDHQLRDSRLRSAVCLSRWLVGWLRRAGRFLNQVHGADRLCRLAASLAPDTLTTAKIATLTGVTEVHHG